MIMELTYPTIGTVMIELICTVATAVLPHSCYPNYQLHIYTYSPHLGGINCDGDCTTVATGAMSDDLYGFALACPSELVGYDYTTWVYGPWQSWRPCLDAGNAIVIDHNSGVVYVDAMQWETGHDTLPWWAYQTFDGWEVKTDCNYLRWWCNGS